MIALVRELRSRPKTRVGIKVEVRRERDDHAILFAPDVEKGMSPVLTLLDGARKYAADGECEIVHGLPRRASCESAFAGGVTNGRDSRKRHLRPSCCDERLAGSRALPFVSKIKQAGRGRDVELNRCARNADQVAADVKAGWR